VVTIIDDWPFVGRERELEVIHRVMARSCPTGVAIFGAAGAGKTSLARVAAEASGSGSLRRVVCSNATRRIALGALAALLPAGIDDETAGRASIISEVIETLSRRGPNGQHTATDRPTVVIDDVHLMDELSAAIVLQGTTTGRFRVVLTARSGEPLPDAVAALLRDGRVERIEVPSLDRRSLRTLLPQALGGPVESAVESRLLAVSGGNALFVRELVLGCLDTGLLAKDGGLWRLRGALASSARLGDLIEARLGAVSINERVVLEHLAVDEPLGVDVLVSLCGREAVESLEQRHLVRIDVDDRRHSVSFDHPLLGEVLRTGLPGLTRMRRARELADALEAGGTRRADDLVRLARLRLDAGEQPRATTLLAAAKRAYASRDLALCERLARGAWDEVGGLDAGLVLVTALAEAGRAEMAEDVIVRLESLPTDDRGRALVAMSRVIHVCFASERVAEHRPVVDAATLQIEEPQWLDELASFESNFAACAAEGSRAVALGVPFASSPWPRVRFAAGFGLAWGHLLTAHPDDAIAVARSMVGTYEDIDDRRALAAPGLFYILEGMGNLEAGRPAGVDLIGEIGHRAELDDVHEDPVRRGWSALLLAKIALMAGRLADAARWGAEAAVLLRDGNHLGARRWALGIRLHALAQLDDLAAAETALLELDAAGPPVVRLLASEDERGRAWLLARRGDRPAAVAHLLGFAAESARRGSVAPAIATIHDVLRLGATCDAQAALEMISWPEDWRIGQAIGALVDGVAAHDHQALEAASAEFADMGMLLAAAESAALGASAAARNGHARRQPALAAHAKALAAECQGARTPALALAVATTPLTDREREIAAAAATGESNGAIATRLGLSKRTVENHLQRVYTKVGATSRDELAELLDLS